MSHNKLTIGLFGFGIVGESLYKVLEQTPTMNATIKKVCIKHPDKPRNAPAHLFTTNAQDLLTDADINVIVELIDDAQAAYHIVTTALKSGKAVVTANKKLVAENLHELVSLQQIYSTPLLYESACCASIPVIRNLEEYYDNDLLHSVSGIVNGSTNYILTRIAQDGLSFTNALADAQRLGFAESNPKLDIEGIDAANKLTILLAHAYGIIQQPQNLLFTGIHTIKPEESDLAKEKGYVIKLVAQARKLTSGKVAAFVLPQLVPSGSRLHQVSNEYNGVEIESSLADKQFFYGKGAGGFPTASAVLSDLSALRYQYKYEYKKRNASTVPLLTTDFYLRVLISFRSLLQVPTEKFVKIEEWVSRDNRCHVTGIIHCSQLVSDPWWLSPDISILLYPDAIIEHYTPTTHKQNLQLTFAD